MRVLTSEGGLSGETLKLGLGAGLTQQTTDRVSACVWVHRRKESISGETTSICKALAVGGCG